MSLSPEKVNFLLNLPKRGGGRKSGPDTNTRDYATWFSLASKMVDESTGELILCDNPNCEDPAFRGTGKRRSVVVEINGQHMCRYCFLTGWLLPPPTEQGVLVDQ